MIKSFKSMKIHIAVLIVVMAVGSTPTTSANAPHESADFETWKAFHHKTYPNAAAEAKAKANFDLHASQVRSHNALHAAGTVTHYRELNAFADISPAEFNKRNGYIGQGDKASRSRVKRDYYHDYKDYGPPIPPVPQSWDYRTLGKGHVDAVGSSLHGVVLLPRRSFNGYAFRYINEAGGVDTSKDYPFTSGGGVAPENTDSCVAYLHKPAVQVTRYELVPNNYTSMRKYLIERGPISVGICADFLQTHAGGIYSCDTNIDNVHINHAVQLVGYGKDEQDRWYWILKNSWGTDWAEKGFFKLRMGLGDCGIWWGQISVPTVSVL